MARLNRKLSIYREAANLFMDKGYAASSMRDLADRVGIEPSSLYSHIKSKEEILAKICLDTAQKFVSGLDQILKTDSSSLDQIDAVVDLHIDIAATDQSSVTVFSNEWRHLPDEERSTFESQRRYYQKSCKSIIKAGIDDGSIVDLDASIATKTILTGLRWVHNWHLGSDVVDYDHVRKEMKKLIRRSLARER